MTRHYTTPFVRKEASIKRATQLLLLQQKRFAQSSSEIAVSLVSPIEL